MPLHPTPPSQPNVPDSMLASGQEIEPSGDAARFCELPATQCAARLCMKEARKKKKDGSVDPYRDAPMSAFSNE